MSFGLKTGSVLGVFYGEKKKKGKTLFLFTDGGGLSGGLEGEAKGRKRRKALLKYTWGRKERAPAPKKRDVLGCDALGEK